MNNLRELETLRKELEELIKIKGLKDDEVLKLSQDLDLYIVQFYIK